MADPTTAITSTPTLSSHAVSDPALPTSADSNSTSRKRKASPFLVERKASLSVDPTTDDDGPAFSTTGGHRTSGGGGGSRDPKRTRVHFSCVECHRRKQKCDRKEPCSQCVARRVPHLCKPFLNGVEDPSQTDVHLRLSSIESLLSRLISSLPALSAAQQQPSTASSPHPTLPPDLSSLQSSGEDIFHPRSDPVPENQQPRQTLPHKPPPSGLFPSNMSQATPTGRSGFGWGLREGRMISLAVGEHNGELKEMLATLKESGISKGHLEWVIAGVPGRRMADGLVELYFRDIDWTRYKMNKPAFMRRYNVFFDSIGRNPTSPRVDPETLKWLPLLFIVLAIATLSAPTDLVPADDQLAWSRRFYGSARSGLEYAKALQRDNLDVLFAGLLASRYMLLTRRPAEGSTPLTTAFQLGLYRDGTVLNLTDKREVEVRRRAWAMLYHLDRTISLLVGRPASISDAHTDTRMPANLDDEELEGDFDPKGHPLTKPTVYTYVIVRHKLAEIMGRIAYHTFAIQLPDYGTVLDLDRELLAWRESLPPFFSMSKPDLSLDKEHPYLFVQRHLLACEWYYTRITLNRPYLLRRKPQDGRYSYSKNAAIESATADLLSRRAFVMEKGNLIVNSGGYRVLNSYMVLGVTIKLDPDSPQADELRHLLNVVSGRTPDTQGKTSEPLVKEELAIVEFLTAKSNSGIRSRADNGKTQPGGVGGGAGPGEDQTPVDLLLGLAKTRSGKRAAEEEKRQARLQQYREAEELRKAQQMQQRGMAGRDVGITSPWGYVAPQMPGLDVQQPFGAGAAERRVPRPLQPPNANKRSDQGSQDWTGDIFDGLQNPFSAPGPQQQMQQQQQPHQQQPQLAVQQRPPQAPQPPQQARPPQAQRQHQPSLSPYEQLAGLPMMSPGQQDPAFGPGGQQFGNAAMDGFDFADLGLVPTNGQRPGVFLEGGGFNPFAIAQEDGSGSDTLGDDDQTLFLNYILTKIANSQPEVQ